MDRKIRGIAEAGFDGLTGRLTPEIRGLAETASLRATGRIADGLCQYLDAMTQAGADADPSVVHLHLGAILRAAKAGSDSKLGDVVTGELKALVERKLTEITPRH